MRLPVGSVLAKQKAAMNTTMREAKAAIERLAGGSPMLQQYYGTKLVYPQFAVMARVGDFYEVLGQSDVDVVVGVTELDVTKRGDSAKCEMRSSRAPPLVAKLVQNNVRVLMLELGTESVKGKNGKPLNVNQRIVSHGFTPGCLVDEDLGVNHEVNNYMLSIAGGAHGFGLAHYDPSTNEMQLESIPSDGCPRDLREHLAGMTNVREVVVQEGLARRLEEAGLLAECSASRHQTLVPEIRCVALGGALVSVRPDDSFTQVDSRPLSDEMAERLAQVGVQLVEPAAVDFDKVLDAAGPETEAERCALLGMLKYMAYLQPGSVTRPDVKKRKSAETGLKMYPAALRVLELTSTMEGKLEGSLLGCIKHTKTRAGGRELHARVERPLRDLRLIKQRHDSVEALGLLDPGTGLLATIRRDLTRDRDIGNIVHRVRCGKGKGVDMAGLLTSLRVARRAASGVLLAGDQADDSVRRLLLGSELGKACTTLLATLSQVESSLNLLRNAYMFADADGTVRDLPASIPQLQMTGTEVVEVKGAESVLHSGGARSAQELQGAQDMLKDSLGLTAGVTIVVEVSVADAPKLLAAGFTEDVEQPCEERKRFLPLALAPEGADSASLAAKGAENDKQGEVRNGFCPELDGLRETLCPEKLREARERICAELWGDYGLDEQVKVHVERDRVSYVEVAVADAPKLLEAGYEEAATLATKTKRRFRHNGLNDLDAGLRRIAELEGMILARARDAVEAAHAELKQVAHALAVIDVSQSNATVADEHAWCRPAMVEDPRLLVEAGEHPVLKDLMGPDGNKQTITHNSLDLQAGTKNSCWVITGPNMGGKSTFLRQNALIVILAQMGSFVPAASAVVGVADQLFCRVGVEDHLTQGRSTFQVEMEEVSHIIKHATERSLVVVDEVGRGTSNADGASLAQAVLEDLVHRVGARTLFATHFHEVAKELAAHTRPMYLHTVIHDGDGAPLPTSAAWAPGRSLAPSYRVVEGVPAASCGLFVADTVGMPRRVVQRAAELLEQSAASSSGETLKQTNG